jgi:RNA polymerase sigma-70 factor (sigma-E family)
MLSIVVGSNAEERREQDRLGELYLRHADRATRLAFLLTGDRAVAEDLVQDAFVRLAGRLAHLRNPEAFEAYLRRTVVNLVNSRFRRLRLERRYLERQRTPGTSGGESDDLSEREDLWRAVRRLPVRQRTALVLRTFEDLPEARVAEILGCRSGTVRSLVSRSLAQLRTEMTADVEGA